MKHHVIFIFTLTFYSILVCKERIPLHNKDDASCAQNLHKTCNATLNIQQQTHILKSLNKTYSAFDSLCKMAAEISLALEACLSEFNQTHDHGLHQNQSNSHSPTSLHEDQFIKILNMIYAQIAEIKTLSRQCNKMRSALDTQLAKVVLNNNEAYKITKFYLAELYNFAQANQAQKKES